MCFDDKEQKSVCTSKCFLYVRQIRFWPVFNRFRANHQTHINFVRACSLLYWIIRVPVAFILNCIKVPRTVKKSKITQCNNIDSTHTKKKILRCQLCSKKVHPVSPIQSWNFIWFSNWTFYVEMVSWVGLGWELIQ